LPAGSVPSCSGIGVGQRPLLSKDGKRITTFVGGALVIGNPTDCNDVIETGVSGAKADFSFVGFASGCSDRNQILTPITRANFDCGPDLNVGGSARSIMRGIEDPECASPGLQD
jgi:hypothetical protein